MLVRRFADEQRGSHEWHEAKRPHPSIAGLYAGLPWGGISRLVACFRRLKTCGSLDELQPLRIAAATSACWPVQVHRASERSAVHPPPAAPKAFMTSSTRMIATPIRLSPAIRPLESGTV